MILTVTLNPAWDVTYPVAALVPGSTHRVTRVSGHAGGKGINVARVLAAMGQPVLATGVLCGDPGRAVAADLESAGVPAAFADGGNQTRTRTTVAIVESGAGAGGQATMFNEPGPEPGALDWPALLGQLRPLIAGSAVVVLSGSLPPALPADAYATLIEMARADGAATILDSDGPPLTEALAAGPDLVKPNRDELARATGTAGLRSGARALLDAGAKAVVVSDGPAGLVAVAPGTVVRARPPALAAVNPTGAGDAAVAALATGLLEGLPWAPLLRRAVAWSAASVLEPVAGVISARTAQRLADLVDVDEHCGESEPSC